jgi:hypothetical protein
VRVTGQTVETLFDSTKKAPTKLQYIKKLSGVVTDADLRSIPEEVKKPVKKKRPTKSGNLFGIF